MALPDLSGMLPLRRESYDALMERQSDGSSLFPKVYEIFCSEMPRLLGELGVNLEKKDSEEAYEVLHQIKGSSAAMGAGRLWELAQFALDMCSDGSVLEERFLLQEIEMEIGLYHGAIRAIREY